MEKLVKKRLRKNTALEKMVGKGVPLRIAAKLKEGEAPPPEIIHSGDYGIINICDDADPVFKPTFPSIEKLIEKGYFAEDGMICAPDAPPDAAAAPDAE